MAANYCCSTIAHADSVSQSVEQEEDGEEDEEEEEEEEIEDLAQLCSLTRSIGWLAVASSGKLASYLAAAAAALL